MWSVQVFVKKKCVSSYNKISTRQEHRLWNDIGLPLIVFWIVIWRLSTLYMITPPEGAERGGKGFRSGRGSYRRRLQHPLERTGRSQVKTRHQRWNGNSLFSRFRLLVTFSLTFFRDVFFVHYQSRFFSINLHNSQWYLRWSGESFIKSWNCCYKQGCPKWNLLTYSG